MGVEQESLLYYVSSTSWSETWIDEIINNRALQRSEYVEVPHELKGEALHKFIDQKLYETTLVAPWYYNIDRIKS